MTKKTKPVEAESVPLLTTLASSAVELRQVPLEQFPPDGELHGPAPSRQFIADVKLRGVIYPVVAVCLPDGGYDVRDGRNRIKTARILGLPWLWALVFSNVGAYEAMTITTAANAHRRANPLADLDVLRRLEGDGKPASWSGLPSATIRKLAKLGQLEPEFVKAIEDGQMSVAAAEALATVEPARREALRDKAVSGEKITAGDVAETKRVQVADAASKFSALLNMPVEPEAEQYVVVDPVQQSVRGYANRLEQARSLAKAIGPTFRVYRLVEV